MGIFTRFRDIVSSNINSMLDKAEDPEKMIKLMIHEMEDTLIDLKTSCAEVIAGQKKVRRKLQEITEKRDLWAKRANLAVNKNRDDLAREALIEKRQFSEIVDALKGEAAEYDGIINNYHDDIAELENKLDSAKEKKRLLVQRHKRASGKKKAHQEIRKSGSADTMARFDKLESRIEQMEAEADLVSIKSEPTKEDYFDEFISDDDIEHELETLKAAKSGATDPNLQTEK